uniref:Uncharacterized protein n=1 Tax=Anguilla anguilla TaxID=7936 RepID=A0A0E9RDG5_ANGAN
MALPSKQQLQLKSFPNFFCPLFCQPTGNFRQPYLHQCVHHQKGWISKYGR